MSRFKDARHGALTFASVARSMVFLIAPLLVLASVWFPLLEHYQWPQATITAPMVESGRRLPDARVLDELRRFYLVSFPGRTPDLEVSAAEAILEGRLELPNLPAGRLATPPAPDDLERLPAGLRLSYAALVVPDLLLAAYASTGRESFFAAARTFLLSWDRYERASLGPTGLLWNDHAIAARVRVLAEFWRIYRDHPDYEPDVGYAVLQQAARYGHFLASAEQFTFATNHGIIQNLGLLLLSLSFPTLPDRDRYHEIALERLAGQLEYLIDDTGVLRENSAGYQAFDLAMLAMTYRAMTLLGDPIPEDWARQYRAGLGFLASLRRPDGSLAMVGDTDAGDYGQFPPTSDIDGGGRAAPLEPYVARPPETAETLDAPAGYWINWDELEQWADGGDVVQTVLAWATPPGTGHEHADEPSLHVWANGIPWITGTGYWPYDDDGRRQAESWPGANAPHLAGEPWASSRETSPLWSGRVDGMTAIDVERAGPESYNVRRQVVRLEPNIWVVVDVTSGGDGPTRTIWTSAPAIELEQTGSVGSYVLAGPGDATARLDLVGSPSTTYSEHRGSADPFAGWQVIHGIPQPAPAVVVERPSGGGWLVTVVSRQSESIDAPRVTGPPTDVLVNAPEAWRLSLSTVGGGLVIERSGSTITAARMHSGATPLTLELRKAPDPGPERERLRAAFERMAATYPQFQPLESRRSNVSILIVLFAFGQEVALALVRRWRRRLYLPLRVLGTLGWVAVAAWLGLVFIRSWQVLTLPS